MADYTGWILLGGAGLAALYLYGTGALGSFGAPTMGYPQQMMPTFDPLASFAPPAQPTPSPLGYYPNYSAIPGINALIPSAAIVAQAPPEYLLPLSPCSWEAQLYTSPSIWAANKIWEMQYNQLAQTIAVRNQLALMRCGMVNFYNILPWDVDFRNPWLHHIAVSKRVIVDEFHRGAGDSGRANSAALDAASAAHPITTGHGHSLRTSSSAGPTPGENSPPIHSGGGGSTHPTTMKSHQAQVIPMASTPQAMPNYDQSKVTPCITGDC